MSVTKSCLLSLLIGFYVINSASSFQLHHKSRDSYRSECFILHASKDTLDRRSLLASITAFSTVLPSYAAMFSDNSNNNYSNSALFRPNPLTNPILEQIRIWDQAEADQLKYGGELERGDAGNRGKVSAYPQLLVPILEIANELTLVEQLVQSKNQQQQQKKYFQQAADILNQPKYEKIAFKKIFNKYGDNIYYSDPDRANLYLGGGATPKTEQSLAYLLRNDILTNVEALQAELEYLLRVPEESTEDLLAYAAAATEAMAKYMELVPPRELEQAKTFLASK